MLERQKKAIDVDEPPKDTVSYFNTVINNTLAEKMLSAGKEVTTKEVIASNAMSNASIDLLCNPHVQSNMGLRNNIQESLGGRPSLTKDGTSIAEVRRKYFQPPPSSSCGTVDRINQRFYNNKLIPPAHIDLSAEVDEKKPAADSSFVTPVRNTFASTTPTLI